MNITSNKFSLDLNLLPENEPTPNDDNSHVLQNFQIDLNQFPEDVTMANNMHHPNKKKNLSSDTRRAIFEMLIHERQDGKLAKGIISKVANSFSISTRSVSRIWHDVKYFSATNSNVPDFSSRLLNRRCRKRVEIHIEQMKDIPFRRRTNIRSLSNALDMSKSTVHRRVKEGHFRPHSNPVKPYLSDENKKTRLEFSLSMVDENTLTSVPTFVNMHSQIHIDEKWFYMSKTSQKYYLHPDETEPFRTCKSKRFITKIMFLAAVARPRVDATTNEEFDGKIGIWPFVSKEPAKRNSKNRVAGTLESKPIVSVTKDVICSCMIENLLPAIKQKWPCSSSRTIFIQQDNAKPHLDINDMNFVEAARKDGFDIRLCCQPANSPDMNVLGLGFFRAIDSIQHQEAPTTIEDFILAVENAFQTFPSEELNNVFLTLQSCMIEVMKNSGDNNYRIPHMNKQKLMRNGQLPNCIQFEPEVLLMAEAALNSTE